METILELVHQFISQALTAGLLFCWNKNLFCRLSKSSLILFLTKTLPPSIFTRIATLLTTWCTLIAVGKTQWMLLGKTKKYCLVELETFITSAIILVCSLFLWAKLFHWCGLPSFFLVIYNYVEGINNHGFYPASRLDDRALFNESKISVLALWES